MNHERDLSIYGDNNVSFKRDEIIQKRFYQLFESIKQGKQQNEGVTNDYQMLASDLLYAITGDFGKDSITQNRIQSFIEGIVNNPRNYLWDVCACDLYNTELKKKVNNTEAAGKFVFDTEWDSAVKERDHQRRWIIPFRIADINLGDETDIHPLTPVASTCSDFCGYTIQALYKDPYSLRIFSEMDKSQLDRKKSKRILTFEHLLLSFYKIGLEGNQGPDELYEQAIENDRNLDSPKGWFLDNVEEYKHKRRKENAFHITVCDQWLVEKITGVNMIFSLFPGCLKDIKESDGTGFGKRDFFKYLRWIDLLLEIRAPMLRTEISFWISRFLELSFDNGYNDDAMIQYIEQVVLRVNNSYLNGLEAYKNSENKISLPELRSDLKALRELFFIKPYFALNKHKLHTANDSSEMTNANRLFSELMYHSLVRTYDLNGFGTDLAAKHYKMYSGKNDYLERDVVEWIKRHHTMAQLNY